MSAVNPTTCAKPSKPYPEFPLFPHATKRWAKKIRGKMHYFGPWDDPDAALDKYLEKKDALHSGLTPRADTSALTVKELANAYLNHKQAKLDAGELSPFTWNNAKEATDLLVSHFGKNRLVSDLHTEDFAKLRNVMANRWGPVRVRDFTQRIRSVFKYGFDAELMVTPMRFGPGFAPPSKKAIRVERTRRGPRMIEAENLRELLESAGTPMKAMILLGINCGFGQSDLANLPLAALDLEGGWIDYPRPKTAIGRRCPLWPETVEAIRAAINGRPAPKADADAGIVFTTKYGKRWVRIREREGKAAVAIDSVRLEFDKLLEALKLKRAGLGFYALRHVHRTAADAAKDQPAADLIMGHARDDMASVYRERISDARLKAVAEHVRAWLFAKPAD